TFAKKPSTSPSFVTSTANVSTGLPITFSAFSSFSSERLAMTTFAPLAAKRAAVARPIPELPPTTTTLAIRSSSTYAHETRAVTRWIQNALQAVHDFGRFVPPKENASALWRRRSDPARRLFCRRVALQRLAREVEEAPGQDREGKDRQN